MPSHVVAKVTNVNNYFCIICLSCTVHHRNFACGLLVVAVYCGLLAANFAHILNCSYPGTHSIAHTKYFQVNFLNIVISCVPADSLAPVRTLVAKVGSLMIQYRAFSIKPQVYPCIHIRIRYHASKMLLFADHKRNVLAD